MSRITPLAIDDHRERAAVFRAFADETLDHDLQKELITLARFYEILASAGENAENLSQALGYSFDNRLSFMSAWIVSRTG